MFYELENQSAFKPIVLVSDMILWSNQDCEEIDDLLDGVCIIPLPRTPLIRKGIHVIRQNFDL